MENADDDSWRRMRRSGSKRDNLEKRRLVCMLTHIYIYIDYFGRGDIGLRSFRCQVFGKFCREIWISGELSV